MKLRLTKEEEGRLVLMSAKTLAALSPEERHEEIKRMCMDEPPGEAMVKKYKELYPDEFIEI